MLIDAMYDRANFLSYLKLHDTQQCGSQYSVKAESSRGYKDVHTSATDTRSESEAVMIVKCEVESNHSSEDPETDKEMIEILTHAKGDKKLIQLNEEESGSTLENFKHRKTSSRVQSRGFRPNYASLEWKDDSDSDDKSVENQFEYLCDIKQEVIEDIIEETNEGTSWKKKIKKDEESDPDFVVSEEEASDLEFSFFSDNEIVQDGSLRDGSPENEASILKPDRKRKRSKSDYPQGVKCRRKRKKKLDEFSDKLEKKSKAERKVKKELESVRESLKKPWVHIKLEDHPEKYRMEIVGSFERKNRNSMVTEELYTCILCGHFKSAAKDIFEEHIEKHVNMVLECDKCTYVGRSEVELNRHRVSTGHMDELRKGQEYVCDICGMVLYNWDARLTHMGKEHDDPQYKCKFCDVKFQTGLKRKQHTRTVHADVAQYCNSCKTDFRKLTLEEYKQHQENCKRGHQCQVCGVVLSSKSVLKRHVEGTHMGVRKFQCHICPYAAKNAKRLKEHVMAHTKVHPYSCDKCSFSCVQPYQLKSHMRTHSGEKPFKCTQCKFAAAWNVQLKQHLSIHALESSVTCRQCDIVFKNEKALKMHEKKDHYVFKLLDAEKTSK